MAPTKKKAQLENESNNNTIPQSYNDNSDSGSSEHESMQYDEQQDTEAVTQEDQISQTQQMNADEQPGTSKAAGKKKKQLEGFEEKKKNSTGLRVSASKRSGLTFPVGRIHRYLKSRKYGTLRVGKTAAVYMASVLEYLVAEAVEVIGLACKQNNRKTISPRHIQLALRQDEEFGPLIKDIVLPNGGVIPHIHEALLPIAKRQKTKK